MRFIGSASGGSKPTAPTIGAATDDGTGTGVSVAFTPSTYIGKGTITYTATSSPGGLTGTSSGSPITVSGLTTGTAYTFTVNGTTNYGVVSDSSAASNSVTPVTPSSFESIATINLSTTQSVTFSSIPSTYKHLQIRAITRNDSDAMGYDINFNGVTTGQQYAYHSLIGSGTTTFASGSGGAVNIIRVSASSNFGTNFMGASIVDILDYTSTTKNKTVRAFSGSDSNGLTDRYITIGSGLWMNTSVISSITISITSAFFVAGTIALYGIKG